MHTTQALINWERVSPFGLDVILSEVLNDWTMPFQEYGDILSLMFDCGSRIPNGLYNRAIRTLIQPIECSHIICTQFETINISISLDPARCIALG